MSRIQPTLQTLSFGPLMNSVGRAKLPKGSAWYLKNATLDRGYIEGSLYLNAASATVDSGGAFLTNTTYGMGYGVYGTTAEMLVVSKRAADATARLWVVNLATNGVTAVQTTGAVVVTDLHASKWEFTQWENYLYAVNETDGMFRYKIGDIDTWEEVKPDTGIAAEATFELNKPPYSALRPSSVGGDAVQANPYTTGYTTQSIEDSTGVVALNCPAAPNLTRRHFAKVLFSSNVDLSVVDFVAYDIYSPNSPFVDLWSGGLWITETVTVAGDDEGDAGFMKGIMSFVGRLGDLAGYNGQQILGVYAGADFTRLLPVSRRNAIRTLGFRFDTDGNYYNAQILIRSIYLGGLRYNNLTRAVNPETGVREYWEWDLEYAVTYYDSTLVAAESDATKVYIKKEDIRGESPFPPESGAVVWPMGALVELTLTSQFTGTYDKIRVYRKFWQQRGNADFVGSWRRVAEVNNTGTPTYEDTYRMTELEALPSGDPQFGNVGLTLKPASIAVWKGAHMVLGYDRKAFLSYGGQPHVYLPPPDLAGFIIPDPEEPSLGATFYAFPNRADDVEGIVAEDPLMLIGSRGVTVVVGDGAQDSTPPRLMPNSRGTLAKRSHCAYGGGAIVAALDGLWFYSASRAFTGTLDSTYKFDELTRDIRKTWRDFVGSSYANLVVTEHQDEIFVFNGIKWLRLNRNRGWEYGEFPNAAYTVEHAVSTLSHGLLALVGPGYLCKVLDYRKDKEDSTTPSPLGTTHSSWEWQSETFDGPRRQITHLKLLGSGTVVVTITIYDGASGVDYAFTKDSSTKVWEEPCVIPPCHRFEVKVTGGSNTDTVEELTLVIEEHDPAWKT